MKFSACVCVCPTCVFVSSLSYCTNVVSACKHLFLFLHNVGKPDKYYEMASFPETKAEKLATKKTGRQLAKFNHRQLTRVYPKGQRIDSSNYDPMSYWNCGCQMLALNYQSPGRPMELNHGRFLVGGR